MYITCKLKSFRRTFLIFELNDHPIGTEHFYNFHGFHGARLTNEQSVRGKVPKPPSGLSRLLLLLLFYAPYKHWDMLNNVYVEGRPNRTQLRVLTEHLVESWYQEIINVSTYSA